MWKRKARGTDGMREKKRPRKKTDALLALVYGYSSIHYVRGRTVKKRGKVSKYRQTFNPLALCFLTGGESTEAFRFVMEAVGAYAQQYHPVVFARLRTVSSTCSDFTGGCFAAYAAVHDAARCHGYKCDEGVWKSTVPCLLTGCEEHAMKNLTGPGRCGISKLRRRFCRRKAAIAGILRARLRFMHRRLGVVLFDMLVFYTLRELFSGTMYGVGVQPRWALYWKKYYLFREVVDGVSLYNAIWRSGTDRVGPRSSDNIVESFHKKVDIAANIRPSFPEFLRRFELAFDIVSGHCERRWKLSSSNVAMLCSFKLAVDLRSVTAYISMWRRYLSLFNYESK